MKNIFIFLSNRHEEIFKYVIILGAVLLIVIALPSDTQFNYEIKKGKPWPYESLIAPFDFAIYKMESELTQERIEAMQNVHPVFVLDTVIATEKIELFEQEYENKFLTNKNIGTRKENKNRSESELEFCVSLLNEIYDNGIVQLDEKPEIQNIATVTLIRSNVAEDRKISSLFTIRSAIEHITKELGSISPQTKQRLLSLME
ncbi:MAG: hypothetical protein JJE25_11710, partial [Bacteroidia bacterium]|nr:hypothetical protein [Bacteroidia bacterium]